MLICVEYSHIRGFTHFVSNQYRKYLNAVNFDLCSLLPNMEGAHCTMSLKC